MVADLLLEALPEQKYFHSVENWISKEENWEFPQFFHLQSLPNRLTCDGTESVELSF